MSELSRDWDLLRAYVDDGSEDAFSQLVGRHLDMVYAACLRQARDRHLAEEATQAVFIILARKARKLGEATVLAAWLYRAARYTALNVLKVENRRRIHELRAAQMAAECLKVDSSWHNLEPLLDEALAAISERDRCAVVLRFLEQRSFREVGGALGISEGAAEMRVSRAVDKLREFFRRRGTALPSAALANVLWVNAPSPAPAGLHSSVSQAALGAAQAGGVCGTAVSLAEAAMKAMYWARLRFVLMVGTASIAAVVAAFLLLSALLDRLRRPAPPPVGAVELRIEAHATRSYR